jgi:hypothetical protein
MEYELLIGSSILISYLFTMIALAKGNWFAFGMGILWLISNTIYAFILKGYLP